MLTEDVDPQATGEPIAPEAVEGSDAAIRIESGDAPDTAPEAGISPVPDSVGEHPVADDVAEKREDAPGTESASPLASGLASDATNPEAEVLKPQHWAQLARLTTEDGSWFVERTWPHTTSDTGKIPVRPFVGPAVYVRCQYGLTLNLGRYESARIDVSLSVPCYPAEVQETYEFVSKWVSERVLQERAEIDAYRQQASPDAATNVSG